MSDEPAASDDDVCGYCGEPGADKAALWTGGGVYWPGETVPDTPFVHEQCEREETARAFDELTPSQREAFLRSLPR